MCEHIRKEKTWPQGCFTDQKAWYTERLCSSKVGLLYLYPMHKNQGHKGTSKDSHRLGQTKTSMRIINWHAFTSFWAVNWYFFKKLVLIIVKSSHYPPLWSFLLQETSSCSLKAFNTASSAVAASQFHLGFDSFRDNVMTAVVLRVRRYIGGSTRVNLQLLIRGCCSCSCFRHVGALKPVWFVVTSVFLQAIMMHNFRFASGGQLNAIHHIVDCFCDVVWPFPGSHQLGWMAWFLLRVV